jgi:hypothetical protein
MSRCVWGNTVENVRLNLTLVGRTVLDERMELFFEQLSRRGAFEQPSHGSCSQDSAARFGDKGQRTHPRRVNLPSESVDSSPLAAGVR